MPLPSVNIEFDPFLTTAKFFTAKIPVKYSKNAQNLATSRRQSNVFLRHTDHYVKKTALLYMELDQNTLFYE